MEDRLSAPSDPVATKYDWWMMSASVQADVNPADRSDLNMVHRTGLLPILRKGYMLATMDGCHQRSFDLQPSAEYNKGLGKKESVSAPRYKAGEEAVGLLQVIKLSQVASVGHAPLRSNTSFLM